MKKRFTCYASRLSFAFVVLVVLGCAPGQTTTYSSYSAPAAVVAGPNDPVLEDVFAQSRIPNGGLWRVFVQGADPDADMAGLWVTTTQLGKKSQVDFILLRGEDRRAFAGYLEIPTPPLFHLGWDYVRVEIRIRDEAGHYSRELEAEAQLGYTSSQAIPEKWRQAAQHRLGGIYFEFESPASDGDGIRLN